MRQPKVQLGLLGILEERLDGVVYERIVGQQVAAAKRAAQRLDGKSRSSYARDDLHDMMRGWGFMLLPENDPTFYEPRYLASLLRESGQTGGQFVHRTPSSAGERFRTAWARLAPANTSPIAFTTTGSDANNLLYDIARSVKGPSAEILALDGVYGGARGKAAELGFMHNNHQYADLRIVSPHSYYFKPTDAAEIQRLEVLEEKALAQIADRVNQGKKPIGGLLLEPIVGARGVLFYRPEFLKKLRELCDQLRIPIFADEILTGGGRTGRFFAYQHYDGFEPDFITFGKGLQIAGVARVSRHGQGYYANWSGTTTDGSQEALLKGAQVLNRIADGNLMENARVMGDYLLTKLRERLPAPPGVMPAVNPYANGDGPVRGMGLLLLCPRSGVLPVDGAMGRLMPYLTITRAEIDRLAREAGSGRR
ncbi:MAG: aminotransferase class III-fold pyridoxal phosphate-dependent enzyme [Deltaproteobacteria bacterium]|nr:aminotransferase class III-fold pyridoxal phosphate-dependent enzyme [Deltaproteobacteria bacterium]